MDCSPAGCSVHVILQARILEWVAVPAPRGSSPAQGWTHVSFISCIGRWVLYHWATWEALDDANGWSQLMVTLETSRGLRILCSKLDRWLWHYMDSIVHHFFSRIILKILFSYSSREHMTGLCFWVHVCLCMYSFEDLFLHFHRRLFQCLRGRQMPLFISLCERAGKIH